MPDYLDVALDDGPGGFARRPETASPGAIVSAHARAVGRLATWDRLAYGSAEVRPSADPKKKAERKAARAARRRNRGS